MEGQTALEHIDAEVKRLADEAAPELLPRLLKIFMSDDRPGLVTCERHMKHLFPYIAAQITLTRAKRRYYRGDWIPPCTHRGVTFMSTDEEMFVWATKRRDEIRKLYRSTPCTCWVKHR